MRLWDGAEAWINPEIDQGFGLSGTLGVAGFISGEAYKTGANYPYTRVQRAFIRQTISLGGETQKVDEGINQFAGEQTADRLVLTVGKFSVGDIFDANKYAHDPRGDFLNWSIIDAGTFDYAAEAWGFSLGGTAEWYRGAWTLRGGVFDMSIVPNSTELDPQFGQFQWIGEIEHRHELWGQPGKIAVTGFLSRGRMGSYADAIELAQLTGGPADIAAVRQYQRRGGVSVNLEQQIVPEVGLFARAGWANGDIVPYSSPTSIAPSLQVFQCKASDGGGPTIPSGSLVSPTEFQRSMKRFSTPAVSAFLEAMVSFRIRVPSRFWKPITASRYRFAA